MNSPSLSSITQDNDNDIQQSILKLQGDELTKRLDRDIQYFFVSQDTIEGSIKFKDIDAYRRHIEEQISIYINYLQSEHENIDFELSDKISEIETKYILQLLSDDNATKRDLVRVLH